MKKIMTATALVGTLSLFSLQALASGSYGGGGFSNRTSTAPTKRAVDQVYETGKAIYNGRQQGEPSLSYCVLNDGEKVPVKRKSLKVFKKTDYNTLAENLFNCDKPDSLVADELTRDSLLYVLYYLNKRHRLKLRGS